MLLWVLVLRGIAIEFRSHGKDRLWRAFWDGTFTLASALAPLLLGVALGNLLRGMPLDSQGWFALPLFDSLWPHEPLGILDAYTLLTGTFALLAIAHHGALFLAWKTDGGVRERARAWAGRGFPVLVVLWLTTTAATLWVRPDLRAVLAQRPLAWAATAVFIAGLATSRLARRRERDLLAFLGSCAFLLGLLAATAAVVHPTMIRAFPVAERSLTALNAASSAESLTKGLLWWPAGFALAVLYLGLLFHIHRGKARAAEDGEGY
jgi:cytochrome d ubiquinol oxidase subunit II